MLCNGPCGSVGRRVGEMVGKEKEDGVAEKEVEEERLQCEAEMWDIGGLKMEER
jgi:hypothetical protein